MKFRKKPVVIEAKQFTGRNVSEIAFFMGTHPLQASVPPSSMEHDTDIPPEGYSIIIPTSEGNMRAIKGDYIIKGVKGEFYPCKPDIFELTYEPVDEPITENNQ